MLLDIQNQFRENYAKSLRGEDASTLPTAYQALYKEWSAKNTNILYKLSDDELVQSFADYVRKHVKEKINTLIQNSPASEAQKQKLRQFAARGQVLLASTDDGQNFDKLVTPDDLERAKSMNYQLLSPTFRTTTTNLREVMDEQTLLNVAANLRAQRFTIQSAFLGKDHTVHMDIVQKAGMSGVEVDLSSEITEPLVYSFIDSDGKEVKRVVETLLPEEFGEPPEEPTLRVPSKEEIMVSRAVDNGASDQALNDFSTGVALGRAINIANSVNAENARAADEAAEQARRGMEAPLLAEALAAESLGSSTQVPNVMAAKAAVRARMERQKKQRLDEQESYRQRVAKRDEELKERREKQEKEEVEVKAQREKQTKNLLRGGVIGGGIAGLTGLAGGGLTLFITSINNML